MGSLSHPSRGSVGCGWAGERKGSANGKGLWGMGSQFGVRRGVNCRGGSTKVFQRGIFLPDTPSNQPTNTIPPHTANPRSSTPLLAPKLQSQSFPPLSLPLSPLHCKGWNVPTRALQPVDIQRLYVHMHAIQHLMQMNHSTQKKLDKKNIKSSSHISTAVETPKTTLRNDGTQWEIKKKTQFCEHTCRQKLCLCSGSQASPTGLT